MRYLTIFFLVLLIIIGCNRTQYITVKHVKPDNRNRQYSRKKDRKKKRVRYVKMKILKQSKEVKPPRKKLVKKKKQEEESEEGELDANEVPQPDEPVNEPDSTGLF